MKAKDAENGASVSGIKRVNVRGIAHLAFLAYKEFNRAPTSKAEYSASLCVFLAVSVSL